MCGKFCTADLVLLISTGVLALVAFAAPYVTSKLWRKFLSPKLKLSYEYKEPMARLSSRTKMDGSPTGEPVYDFHFLVENHGRSPAECAVAVVTEFWYDDPFGKLVKFEAFMPVPLRYDGRGEFVDVYPHRPYYWNIGFVYSPNLQAEWDEAAVFDAPERAGGGLRFGLDLHKPPYYQVNRPSKGHYRIKVVVYSKNAEPAEILLEIIWLGEWKETKEEMFKQIKIREVE